MSGSTSDDRVRLMAIPPILRVIGWRLAQAVPTLLGVVAICFALLAFAPGDLVDVMAAEGLGADGAQLARLRALYGLDVPLPRQLLNYLLGVLRLDLGWSHRHNAPVLGLILERLPASLILMIAAMTIASVLGVAAGAIAALRVNTATDVVLSVLAVLFFATPSFWFSLMLVVLFSVKLGLTPVAGMATIGGPPPGAIAYALDVLHHLVLPAIALGLFFAAIYARVMRASMLQVFALDFVRTARAKGMPARVVALRHVFRNAILPVVTLIGIQFATVFAGSVVVESVFSWPGIGSLLLEAVGARNYPVVMGVMIFSALVVIAANLLVDLLYLRLDPRVELR